MNRIIITNDIQKITDEIKADEVFIKDELKMEDVKEIKKAAYLKEKRKKTVLISANRFNIYSQNALLKLFEESPKGVEFVLVADSKYKLLETVLSRMVIEKRFFEKGQKEREIKIDNKTILDLLNSEPEKDEIKEIIKSLLKFAKNSEHLEIINNALLMLELNLDKEAVLSMVMLSLKDKR